MIEQPKPTMVQLPGAQYQYEVYQWPDGRFSTFPVKLSFERIFGETPEECARKAAAVDGAKP
jgi:hypothetical protein